MPGYIATPARPAPASPSTYWRGQGGAGGSVATPSRDDGVATPPPLPMGGIQGPIRASSSPINRNNPFPVFEGITGLGVTHYVRKWTANFMGLLKFNTVGNGPTDWTTNRSQQSLSSADPIRVDSRFSVQTFRREFDTRLQADYLPSDSVQRDQYLVVSSAKSDTRMVEPYFNRMTMYRSFSPYAAQTQVLG